MLLKKDYVIGLDIGSSSVKLAQFIRKEDNLYLVKTDLQEFGMVADETLYQQEALTALESLLGGIDRRRAKFVVTLNCPKTAVKSITMPVMPLAELRETIELNAKNYFPFPLVDALFDCKVQREIIEDGLKKYRVLVATSPRATINRYLSLLEEVGLHPACLLPASCTLEGLLAASSFRAKQTVCFLDLGCRFSELVIFKEHFIEFSRKVPVAGMDFTRALTDVLISEKGRTELSFNEAEEIKRQLGIPLGGAELPEGKISSQQILSMLRPSLERLATEIERCFAYYREECPGNKIEAMVLFGGTAQLKGLDRFLADWLGIEVHRGDSLPQMHTLGLKPEEKEKSLPQLALSVGAGLSQGKGINLLPPEIKEQKKRTLQRATWESVFAAATLVLAFIYIGMQITLGNFQKKIAANKMELASFTPQINAARPDIFIQQIAAKEPLWEEVFKELSNVIPTGIYLDEFSQADKQFKLRGKIAAADAQSTLSEFLFALSQSMFKQVKIANAQADTFELECQLN